MKKWAFKAPGFTIVELLIVVVVIAILASVTILGYNGVTQRANITMIQLDFSNLHKSLQTEAVEHSVTYTTPSIWTKAMRDAGVYDAATPDDSTRKKTFAFCAAPTRYAIGVKKPLLSETTQGSVWYYFDSQKGQQTFSWDTSTLGSQDLERLCHQALPGFTWSAWSFHSAFRT